MANLAVSFRNTGNRTIRVIDQTACGGLEHSFLSMLSRVVNADTSATVITGMCSEGGNFFLSVLYNTNKIVKFLFIQTLMEMG